MPHIYHDNTQNVKNSIPTVLMTSPPTLLNIPYGTPQTRYTGWK